MISNIQFQTMFDNTSAVVTAMRQEALQLLGVLHEQGHPIFTPEERQMTYQKESVSSWIDDNLTRIYVRSALINREDEIRVGLLLMENCLQTSIDAQNNLIPFLTGTICLPFALRLLLWKLAAMDENLLLKEGAYFGVSVGEDGRIIRYIFSTKSSVISIQVITMLAGLVGEIKMSVKMSGSCNEYEMKLREFRRVLLLDAPLSSYLTRNYSYSLGMMCVPNSFFEKVCRVATLHIRRDSRGNFVHSEFEVDPRLSGFLKESVTKQREAALILHLAKLQSGLVRGSELEEFEKNFTRF